MSDHLHLDGVWPEPVTVRRGWAKAVARPWNDDVPDPTIRLERGSSDFLGAVAHHLAPMGSGSVYSPALYPSATGVWGRAGFSRFGRLTVMERSLAVDGHPPQHPIDASGDPDWTAMATIDGLAFEGFWRMNRSGIIEAMRATPRAVVLQARVDGHLAGYALVGAQTSLSFLQRVAVAPKFSGRGLGTSLVRAARDWAAARRARAMVLNLRPENNRARHLYEREGFVANDTELQLLRFES